jgi:hypothetical protein
MVREKYAVRLACLSCLTLLNNIVHITRAFCVRRHKELSSLYRSNVLQYDGLAMQLKFGGDEGYIENFCGKISETLRKLMDWSDQYSCLMTAMSVTVLNLRV